MDVQIFQYKESHLGEIRIILNEFLSFIANELTKPPWNFNLDEDHEVDLTINNLDKFAEPDGRLLLFEVDGQITGTISLRKIREYSGEIKRMYVRLKFRGEKLGNLMIEEVIRVSKENGFPKLIWWIVRFLFRPLYTLYRHLIFHRDDIDFPIP
jgi:GNAT superfamily N-acetyltransferase